MNRPAPTASALNRRLWNYLYVVIACSSSAVMSLSGAWSSPALAKLGDTITRQQVVIIQAALPAGASVGVIVGWVSADAWGRRLTMIVGGFISTLGWALLAFPSLAELLIVGRVVSGLAVGLLNISAALYIPEIVTAESRGVAFSVAQIFTNLGCLVAYALGPFIALPGLAIASATHTVCFTLLCFLLPESPNYLVSAHRIAEAQAVLVQMRGREDVRQDLKKIEQRREEGVLRRWLGTLVAGRQRLVGLIGVVCGACLLKQVTGGLALVSYAQPLFLHSNIAISSDLASLVLGAFKTLGSCLTTCLARTLSLRTLLLVSCSGVAFFLLSLAGYLYAYEEWDLTFAYVQWIPLVCMTMYFVFLDIGIGPFPSFLGSEILEWRARGGGVATALCLSYLVSTVAVSMVVTWYLPLAIGVFGMAALVAAPLLYFSLPKKRLQVHPVPNSEDGVAVIVTKL